MATSDRNMAIGINPESIVDWSPAWTFIDLFQASRPWISQVFNTQTGSISFDESKSPLLDLDANGNVRSLKTFIQKGVEMRQFAATLMFRDVAADGGYPGGLYTARWDGTGDLTFNFDAEVVNRFDQDGHHFAQLQVSPSSNGILLTIEATDTNDPIRNIHLWMPDYQGQSFSGKVWQPGADFSPFHPLYLELLAPFKTLRFMGMQETNSSDIVRWNDRRSVDAVRQASGSAGTPSQPLVNGMAVEMMVQLANDLDADPWFNMPHQADDEFVRNIATYVRDHLEEDRTVYVEWGNEVWNFGFGFEVSQWVADQAAARGLSSNPDSQWIITGEEARRDFDIWSDVFKETSHQRLVRVAAGQAANEYIVNAIAENMGGSFDALSLAPYITPTDEQRASYSAQTTVDQVIADTRANIATSVEWVSNHRQLADAWSTTLGRPIQLLAYEGGPHLDGRNEPYQPAFLAAVRDPRMGDIYRDYLSRIEAAGLDLYLDFQFTGQDVETPFGDFGKLHRMDQSLATAYGYNALVTAAGVPSGSPQFRLAIAPLAKPEGAAGSTTTFSLTIQRTGDLNAAASVRWSVSGSGDSPASPSDFSNGVLPSGDVTFAAGEASHTITIMGAGDDNAEGDEQFTVQLSNAVGAVISPSGATVTGTIQEDDDPTPPRFTGLSVRGSQLELQCSEPIVTTGLTPSLTPARFSVRVAGEARRIATIAADAGDPRTLLLTLSGRAPGSGQEVQVSYIDPGSGDESTGVVQDVVGNDMTSTATPISADRYLSAGSVTNLASTYRDLVLTGTAVTGTGNAADNLIRVEQSVAIANVLVGAAGNDALDAGDGSDLYLVAQASHHSAAEINDSGTGGIDDLLFSSITPKETLRLFPDDTGLERVLIGTLRKGRIATTGRTALQVDASAAPNGLSLFGNMGANTLIGTAFADRLAAGLGNDQLAGGAAADVFLFDTAPKTSNADTLVDFTPAEGDRIELARTAFRGLPGVGVLTASAFTTGSAATSSAHRIIYTPGSGATPGQLIYDRNGSASGGAVLFALVPGDLALDASMFLVS